MLKKIFVASVLFVSTSLYAQVVTVGGILFPSGNTATLVTNEELIIGGPSSDFASIKFPIEGLVSTCNPHFERRSIEEDIANYGKAILVVVTASDCPYCMNAATSANSTIMSYKNDLTIWFADKKLYADGSCEDIELLKGRFNFLNEAKFSFIDASWSNPLLPGGRKHHNVNNSAFWTTPDMPSVYRIIDPITKKVTNLGYGLVDNNFIDNAIAKNFNPGPNLNVATENLVFFNQGNTVNISVSSSIAWSVKSLSDWVTITTTSGNGNMIFQATATANNGAKSRTGVLSFSGIGNRRMVEIKQNGIGGNLNVSTLNVSFPIDASSTIITVTSNVNWKVFQSDNWITLASASGINNGKFSISVRESLTAHKNNTVLTVVGDGITKYITVTQEPVPLIFETDLADVAFSGINSSEVFLSCNTYWSITGLPSWLTADPNSGDASNIVILSTNSDNTTGATRNATISFVGFNTARMVTVSQTSSTTNIEKNQFLKSNNYTLSPNPIGVNQTLKLNPASSLKLFNTMGKLLIEVKSTKEIDLKGLNQGLYFVQTEDNKIHKLIIE